MSGPASTFLIHDAPCRKIKSAEPVLYLSKDDTDWRAASGTADLAKTSPGGCLVALSKSMLKLVTSLMRRIPWPLTIYALVLLAFTMFGFIYHSQLLGQLNVLSKKISSLHWEGYAFCGFLCMLTTVPFSIGHSLCCLLCGITFGFPNGVLPAYLGSISGAALSFLIIRSFFMEKVKSYIESSSSTLTFAREMILEHPIKFLFIFRLAPLPFNMLNFICSGLDVSFVHYIFVTFVACFKVALPVYVGGTLGDIAEAHAVSGVDRAKVIQLVMSIGLMLLFMLLSTVAYFHFKKKWHQRQSRLIEVEASYPPDERETMSMV